MKKTGGEQIAITDKIKIPKGIRSLFTPAQIMVLAVVYLGCKADLCKLTVTQIAQRAGINIARVRKAIVLAAQLGVLDVIVDDEGKPIVIRNIAIMAMVKR
jgi:hypothetical protein